MNKPEVLTVGHSSASREQFVALLRQAEVTAVGDVRSAPYSRYLPHFNREPLRDSLRDAGMTYVYLGEELGGRPKADSLYRAGVADYERMADEPSFQHGLRRVMDGATRHRLALMCTEQNPSDCHRCLLVGRALAQSGAAVLHILPDGGAVTQADIEEALLRASGRAADDLFASREERLALAYRERARKVAFEALAPAVG